MNPTNGGGAESSSGYRWLIVFLCLLAYTVSMVSRFAWPPLISVVAPEFGISMAEAGAYMTGFYIGYVVTQIPSGMLADTFGVRALLALTLLAQAAATFLLGEVADFGAGFGLRLISGLAGGCVYAACFRLVVQWFPERERGIAFGLLMCAPSLGVALANAFVPAMEAAWGWRRVFNAIGLFALAGAALVFLFIREAPNGDDPSGKPKTAGKPEIPEGPEKPPAKSFVAGLRYVIGDRDILLLSLCGFTYVWAYIGFVSWGNTYMKETLGVGLAQAGHIMSGMAVAGLFSSLVIGAYAGKSGTGRRCLVIGNAALAVGIVAFGQMTAIPGLWVFALFAGVASGVMNAVNSLVVSLYSKPEWAGSVGGVTNCVWQIAGILVPVVSGWAIDAGGSFDIVWYILAAGALLGVVFLALLRPPAQA